MPLGSTNAVSPAAGRNTIRVTMGQGRSEKVLNVLVIAAHGKRPGDQRPSNIRVSTTLTQGR